MADKGYDRLPTMRSRELRSAATEAERKLWGAISSRQMGGVRFNRQVPIGPFICDFVARSANLVVEVDGGQHGNAVTYDEGRTAFLQNRGYQVLRFWNNEVQTNLTGVIGAISEALKSSPSQRSRRGRAANGSDGAGLLVDDGTGPPLGAPRLSPPAPAGGAKGEQKTR